jgi:uncharacterized membrane protein (Fun14 family)
MLNNSWWAHFIGPVLTVIGVLILAVASLAWRTVLKIEQKLESYLESNRYQLCRKNTR